MVPRPDFPMGHHHKITTSVDCRHKSLPILIWPMMLQGHKTPTINQPVDLNNVVSNISYWWWIFTQLLKYYSLTCNLWAWSISAYCIQDVYILHPKERLSLPEVPHKHQQGATFQGLMGVTKSLCSRTTSYVYNSLCVFVLKYLLFFPSHCQHDSVILG